jgi:hypothetical protein
VEPKAACYFRCVATLARGRSRRIGAALVGLAAGLAPAVTEAGNEAHVRTPVLWQPAPACGVVVDRSVDPVLHLDYAIPVEDTQLGPEELADSRTQQFLALCRERPADELLPNWITRDDLERAIDAGIVGPELLEPANILDESSEWAGCSARITADDARRPITFEQAALGVDWDTSAVEAGVWSVAGYTFEPALNLWSPRRGFVKIVDDPSDPEQDLPALAITTGELGLEAGEAAELEGCADAFGEARVELEWARFAPEREWRALAAVDGVEDGALSMGFVAPCAAAGEAILVRARIVDELGRSALAHAPAAFAVLPSAGECSDEPDDSAEGTGEGTQQPGCRLARGARGGLAWLALVLLPLLRDRRGAKQRRQK